MDFDYTEEQRLLRDSVDRLLADRYAFDKRRAYLAEPQGWTRALRSHSPELGLLGLPFSAPPGRAGGRHDRAGIPLFLVDAAANGVARRAYTMRDGTRAAEISLSGVEVDADAVLGEVGGGFAVIERVVEAGIAATAAEAVGT